MATIVGSIIPIDKIGSLGAFYTAVTYYRKSLWTRRSKSTQKTEQNTYQRQEQSKAAIGRYLQVYEKYQDLPELWTKSAEALKALYLAQGEKQLAKNVQVKLDQQQEKKRKKKQEQKTKKKTSSNKVQQ